MMHTCLCGYLKMPLPTDETFGWEWGGGGGTDHILKGEGEQEYLSHLSLCLPFHAVKVRKYISSDGLKF